MRVVSTEKAFALIFENAQDLVTIQVEIESMIRKIDEGLSSLPLSFVVMDEGATDADKEELSAEIDRTTEG